MVSDNLRKYSSIVLGTVSDVFDMYDVSELGCTTIIRPFESSVSLKVWVPDLCLKCWGSNPSFVINLKCEIVAKHLSEQV